LAQLAFYSQRSSAIVTMAPKLPGKFDDISKAASGVLGDDFQTKGYQFKVKQGSNFGGASADVQVDYSADADVKTPTKITCKLPKPVPCMSGVSIDKLEVDKSGNYALETSLAKALHSVDGLKLDVKTDFAKKLNYSATFTGVKDAALKFETSHFEPATFTAEVLYGTGPAVVGAQLKGNGFVPAVGVSYTQGDIFASVLAKNKFQEFTLHGLYNAPANAKVAATYQQGGKDSGSWSVGCAAKATSDTNVKAKFDSKQVVSISLKKELAPKTNLFAGLSYNTTTAAMTYGAKLTIE